jgi:SAM-dependent methyltransferase
MMQMRMAETRSTSVKIALATFAILTLELALIRWTSQQVRVFAYFNNLTLIAAFLGMGLGVALGAKRPNLQHWTLPTLLVLSAILGTSARLGLVYLRFPDISLSLWGSESLLNVQEFLTSVATILLLFALILMVFLCAGTIVGALFTKLPPLAAYSADLIGSFAGVVVMTLVAALGTTPPIWFAIAAAPLLYFSRRVLSIVSLAGILIFAWYSIEGAKYSPYYRIDITRNDEFPGRPVQVSVNRDFHQFMQDLSSRGTHNPEFSIANQMTLQRFAIAYSIPFRLTPRRDSALIVGAGTGNDVSAALRSGFRHVVSVDIDPLIIKLGQQGHPEHPYGDPRAVRVVNDARAYFEQHTEERFDVVCFGLLDSHAMFSSMSSLRLENYVYTVESVRDAWRLVKPGGVLTLSFSTYAGDWISDRLYAVIWDATGVPPIIVILPMHQARMFVVGKQISLPAVAQSIPFTKLLPTAEVSSIRVPTDDWPFLYIRPGTFPIGYLIVIGGLLLIATVGSLIVFGKDFASGRLDAPLFLMGAAFLLIETRGIVDLSLLFGSTWIVNSTVIAGILFMAYLANLYVTFKRPANLRVYFVMLWAALLINYAIRPSLLLTLTLGSRAVIGGLLNAVPVFFAGIIFSALFSRASHPSASLGSNLLGAVVGGCLEYVAMFTGLKFLSLIALTLYLVTFLLLQRHAASRLSST